MKIRAGYDIAFQCPYAVPMVLMLTTHPSRDGDILSDQSMQFSPCLHARDYFDPYGNICTRLPHPAYLKSAASSSSRTAACRMRCARQRNSGASPNCPVTFFPSLLASRTATLKNCRTWPGHYSGAFKAAGSERRQSVTTPTTASNVPVGVPLSDQLIRFFAFQYRECLMTSKKSIHPDAIRQWRCPKLQP